MASRFPTKGTCLAIYSRVVNAEMPLDAALRGHFPWCSGWAFQLRELFGAYIEAKQAQNVLDYDDLLLYWAQTVSDPVLAADIGARFDHVLVDEYQDTNRLQSSILLALKPDGAGLTVVGDDAQSIYPKSGSWLWIASRIGRRSQPLRAAHAGARRSGGSSWRPFR
jgi:DNA helicase-2/ATP-dependent DNA helicase PcrA